MKSDNISVTYWVGFYLDDENNRVRGEWKTSEQAVNDEANSHLYRRQLGLVLIEKGKITGEEVEKIAKIHNCSIVDVLSGANKY